MNASVSAKNLKWHFPRITELYYPNQVRSTEEWDNWLKAMTLDRRLSERAKLVLTRLALYLNLKTGRCDPTVRHLAMMSGLGENDSAERMARRALSEGQRLGWIRRIRRDGGNVAYSQSNLYELTISAAVYKALGRTDSRSGRTDSRLDRTGESYLNREVSGTGKNLEHSLSSIEPRSPAPAANSDQAASKGSGTSEVASEGYYTTAELERVRDALAEGPLTLGGIICFLREHDEIISGAAIAHMARDGHLKRLEGRYHDAAL